MDDLSEKAEPQRLFLFVGGASHGRCMDMGPAPLRERVEVPVLVNSPAAYMGCDAPPLREQIRTEGYILRRMRLGGEDGHGRGYYALMDLPEEEAASMLWSLLWERAAQACLAQGVPSEMRRDEAAFLRNDLEAISEELVKTRQRLEAVRAEESRLRGILKAMRDL